MVDLQNHFKALADGKAKHEALKEECSVEVENDDRVGVVNSWPCCFRTTEHEDLSC